MEKILTISIAAYNVADYIKETLDSLISSRYIDQLEIFVVDDGGQDATLEIAKQYQQNYPTSIIPVHKKNGGYGTTVNHSLENATGKYFKLLDGDDWVETNELDKLISQLLHIETDVVITPYLSGPTQTELNKIDFNIFKNLKEEVIISELSNFDTVGMWAICYKTSLLRKANLSLPEKLFYTDQIYCTIPFAYAETLRYFDNTVYCYRVGREGQSVSRESRVKNIDMTLDICKMLAQFVVEKSECNNYQYLLARVTSYYFSALKTILLLNPNESTRQKLKNYDQEIKNISEDMYNKVATYNKLGRFVFVCRKANYYPLYALRLIYPNGVPNWA